MGTPVVNDGEMEGGELHSDNLEEDGISEDDGTVKLADENDIVEPYIGMEFKTEDDARNFYNDYARRVGFMVRIMQRRRSEIDGRTLARRLGCNKQGFSPGTRGKMVAERKARPSAREGCKATILFKMDKSGNWMVTRFIKEHNHPLVVTTNEYTDMLDKDKKIEELTLELQRQEELCAAYREKLMHLLGCIETQADHLSSKVQTVAQNVRKAEAEALALATS